LHTVGSAGQDIFERTILVCFLVASEGSARLKCLFG
jgi:hypothetical protein